MFWQEILVKFKIKKHIYSSTLKHKIPRNIFKKLSRTYAFLCVMTAHEVTVPEVTLGMSPVFNRVLLSVIIMFIH